LGKWLDLAAKLEAEDNRYDRDNRADFVPNVPFVRGEQPVTVQAGLHKLKQMAAPSIVRAVEWREVVADALRVAQEGWAHSALGLGWSELDLFGVARGSDPSTEDHGLAVWLRGRRILALTAEAAIADDGPGARSYFMPGRPLQATLLWEIKA
jgi:hypothetical protein